MARTQKADALNQITLFTSEAGTGALTRLTVAELDMQIDKLRSINKGLVAPKSSFKGAVDGRPPKEQKVHVIVDALKRAEEMDAAELELVGGEQPDEDFEQGGDEAMLFEDEVF
jgi:hypothetical protein